MSQLGQAQVGTLKSSPKVCTIKGDDNLKVIYKNMGNGHAVPVLWTDSVTLASGTTEIVVASGIKMHGMPLATNASVTFACTTAITSGTQYIVKDTGANTITLTSSVSYLNTDVNFDVMFMLGNANAVFTTAYRDMDSPVNPNVPSAA